MSFQSELTRKVTKRTLYGFGGWLYFFSFCQLIAVAMIVYNLFNDILPSMRSEMVDAVISSYPIFNTMIYYELTLSIVVIALAGAVIYLTIKRSRHYATVQIAFLSVILILNVGVPILMDQVNQDVGATIYENPYSSVGRSVILCIIWILYFVRSHRVANTFNR
jgi:hypothetical protein